MDRTAVGRRSRARRLPYACPQDFENIIEIELSAEGFLAAKILAHKFITLFLLSKELLSKQHHYDWGLRAIKSVLVVAGMLKRGDRERPEDQVLMRALRSPPNTPLPIMMLFFPQRLQCAKDCGGRHSGVPWPHLRPVPQLGRSKKKRPGV